MLKLFTAFLELVLMRRGPESIPAAPVFLAAALLLWFAATLCLWAVIETFTGYGVFVAVLSQALSLTCYRLVLHLRGYAARTYQTLTSIAGASAMIALLLLTWVTLVEPLLENSTAILGRLLLMLWAVQVEGNIIGRASGTGLFLGTVIAACVFMLQYSLEMTLTAG